MILERELNRIINGIIDSSKEKDIDKTMEYVSELEELVGEDTAQIIFEKLEAKLNA